MALTNHARMFVLLHEMERFGIRDFRYRHPYTLQARLAVHVVQRKRNRKSMATFATTCALMFSLAFLHQYNSGSA
jgi:hypothetical protein